MYPHELRYSPEHTWVRRESPTVVRFGVSNWIGQELGDITRVQLPQPGEQLSAGEACGAVESQSEVSDLYSPVDGVVLAVNEELEESPDLVNASPYGEGWMVEVECASSSDVDSAWESLLESDDYEGALPD